MAKLIKTVIKKGPSQRKEKLMEVAEFTETATSYVNALRSQDIQPEFIVKHAEQFRNMFFDFLNGRVAYKEDVNGTTERIEEQAKEISKLRGDLAGLKEELEELRAEIKAGAKETDQKKEGPAEPKLGGSTGPSGLGGSFRPGDTVPSLGGKAW